MQSSGQYNIIKFEKTPRGYQWYRCKTCGRTFVETKGTLFYRRRIPAEEILDALALLAEGERISSLVRVKGHKEETVLDWLQETAEHVEAVESVLLVAYQVTR